MARVLLVANKTLASGEVSEYVRTRMAKEPCEFTLLVPATPRWDREPASRLASGLAGASEGAGPSYNREDNYEYARSRLEFGLNVLRGLGATVDGDVGDPDPSKAIPEMLKRRQFDEVALSTLPKGISRWLGLDIPRQVERKFHVPVTVIKVQDSAYR
jgi:GABA permease